MAILDIAYYGNPILDEPARTIETLTPEIQQLVDDMLETVIPRDGIGLAAPQVGHGLRLIVVDEGVATSPNHDEEDRKLKVYFNPEIVEESAEDAIMEEGCLSLPDIRGEVYRPVRIRFRARDAQLAPVEFEAEGLYARVLLHETDHTNGVLFIERMSRFRRMALRSQLATLRRVGRAQEPIPQIATGGEPARPGQSVKGAC